jgi:hypothetical protein
MRSSGRTPSGKQCSHVPIHVQETKNEIWPASSRRRHSAQMSSMNFVHGLVFEDLPWRKGPFGFHGSSKRSPHTAEFEAKKTAPGGAVCN